MFKIMLQSIDLISLTMYEKNNIHFRMLNLAIKFFTFSSSKLELLTHIVNLMLQCAIYW